MSDRDVSVRALAAVAVLSLSTFAYVTTEALPIGLLTPIAESLGRRPRLRASSSRDTASSSSC